MSVSLISARRGLGRAYGCDEILNGRAVHGGDGFVVDERLVGGGLDDTIKTVDRLRQGLTTEHLTGQTAASATATSFIHYGIQILSHRVLDQARTLKRISRNGSLEAIRPACVPSRPFPRHGSPTEFICRPRTAQNSAGS